MSTRGLYGIRKNGTDKTTYNHCDSYPDYLGREVLEFCRDHDLSELSEIYDNIVMVDECAKPSKNQMKHISQISGSEPTPDDYKNNWYGALRIYQGDLSYLANAKNLAVPAYMTEGSNFIKNSIFCEFAYIINLDTGTLEFYNGSEKKYNPVNRYSKERISKKEDFPCRLALIILLSDIFNASDEEINDLVDKMNNS